MIGLARAALVTGALITFGGIIVRLGPGPEKVDDDPVGNAIWRIGVPVIVTGVVLMLFGAVGIALA